MKRYINKKLKNQPCAREQWLVYTWYTQEHSGTKPKCLKGVYNMCAMM